MPLADDARTIRAAADASWEQLEALLPEKAALAAFGGRRPARADFQWAFSMLLSRLIRLRSLGDREALVPWADLLNHSPDSDAYLDWDAAQRAVVLRADAAAQPGQQLFASYGTKASGALLLRCAPSSSLLVTSMSKRINPAVLQLALSQHTHGAACISMVIWWP